MKRTWRILVLLPLLLLVAADQPVKVLRMGHTRMDRLGVSTLDSFDYQSFRTGTERVRRLEYVGRLMKFTFSDASDSALILNYEPYEGGDAELRAGYVFVSASPASASDKAAMRIKLTRLLEPVEVLVPLGADSQYMIDRAKKLRAGDVVVARFKGGDNRLTELAAAGEIVRGFYNKTTQVTVGTRKVPGIEVEVNGAYQSFALPPAGRKSRAGDADVLAVSRKLKKGTPIRITVDSDQPEVLSSVEINIEVYRVDEDDYRIQAPGMSATFHISKNSGRVSATIKGAAITDADRALVRGLQRSLDGRSNVSINFAEQQELSRMILSFTDDWDKTRDQNSDFSFRLRSRLPLPAEPKQTAAAAIDLMFDANATLRNESKSRFDQARRLLGDERTAQLEKLGASSAAPPAP